METDQSLCKSIETCKDDRKVFLLWWTSWKKTYKYRKSLRYKCEKIGHIAKPYHLNPVNYATVLKQSSENGMIVSLTTEDCLSFYIAETSCKLTPRQCQEKFKCCVTFRICSGTGDKCKEDSECIVEMVVVSGTEFSSRWAAGRSRGVAFEKRIHFRFRILWYTIS